MILFFLPLLTLLVAAATFFNFGYLLVKSDNPSPDAGVQDDTVPSPHNPMPMPPVKPNRKPLRIPSLQ